MHRLGARALTDSSKTVLSLADWHCLLLCYRFTGTESKCTNLASYNYLGFAESSGPCAESAKAAINKFGVALCSSRQELGWTIRTLFTTHFPLAMEIFRDVPIQVLYTLNVDFDICSRFSSLRTLILRGTLSSCCRHFPTHCKRLCKILNPVY